MVCVVPLEIISRGVGSLLEALTSGDLNSQHLQQQSQHQVTTTAIFQWEMILHVP
jgi:hypothetical protein